MATPNIKVKVPEKAKKGEVFEIKTTIGHDMESGQRKDKDGKTIPRKIINSFTATYNGEQIFASDWNPSVSANPYLSFYTTATESGVIEFAWNDDDGATYKHSVQITVE